jgi:hypothetical protein
MNPVAVREDHQVFCACNSSTNRTTPAAPALSPQASPEAGA